MQGLIGGLRQREPLSCRVSEQVPLHISKRGIKKWMMLRQQQKLSLLAATCFFEFFLLSTAFLSPQSTHLVAANDSKNSKKESHFKELFSSSSSSSSSSPNVSFDDESTDRVRVFITFSCASYVVVFIVTHYSIIRLYWHPLMLQNLDKNSRYIKGLMDNLSALLDKYMLSGSPKTVSLLVVGRFCCQGHQRLIYPKPNMCIPAGQYNVFFSYSENEFLISWIRSLVRPKMRNWFNCRCEWLSGQVYP